MTKRPSTLLLGALAALAAGASAVRADDDAYRQLSVTTNPLLLLVPVFELDGEFALHRKWSVAVRGGIGYFDAAGPKHRIIEGGARATHYVLGNASRGVQLGVDGRFVSFEGDGQFLGLGDGAAIGAFVGYKRAFDSGVTLGVQLGAHGVLAGESEQNVLPHIAVALGGSFLRVGGSASESVVATPVDVRARPLDYHRGLLLGFSLGGGTAFIEGCTSCSVEPGIAVDASIGWFLSRRFAIVLDSTAMVALFSLSSGFGGFGFGLTSLALQAWPHDDVWLKLGVGGAQLTSTSLGGVGLGVETGGGGTFAAGYEFHHDRTFNMDVQLRVTHGSFEPINDSLDGVNTFVGLVGLKWY